MPFDFATRPKRRHGRVQAAIINRLRMAEGAYVSLSALVEHVYDDPDQEPDYAEESIRHSIHRLRAMGFPIASHIGRESRGYRFAPTLKSV